MHLIWSLLFLTFANAAPLPEDFGATMCFSVSGSPLRPDMDRALSPSDFSGFENVVDGVIAEARASVSGDLCDDREALKLVSWRINEQIRYAGLIDSALFKQKDYWQTTHELFQTKLGTDRYGDCEDLAIAKYWALRRAGCEADKMYITVLAGQPAALDHAILTVKTSSAVIVLDNRGVKNGLTLQETGYLSSMKLGYLINERKLRIRCAKGFRLSDPK